MVKWAMINEQLAMKNVNTGKKSPKVKNQWSMSNEQLAINSENMKNVNVRKEDPR
jgi:hypothetical protein